MIGENQWSKRTSEYTKGNKDFIPRGIMKPIGYLIMQYTDRSSRPVKSILNGQKIPQIYLQHVLKTEIAICLFQ